jgi:hypothetical protein
MRLRHVDEMMPCSLLLTVFLLQAHTCGSQYDALYDDVRKGNGGEEKARMKSQCMGERWGHAHESGVTRRQNTPCTTPNRLSLLNAVLLGGG